MVSLALVARTTHEPAAVGDIVEPETVQLPDTLANEYAPVPDPPDAVSVRLVPNVADAADDIETVDWSAPETVAHRKPNLSRMDP